MRTLFTTSLTPLALLLATAVHAETLVDTKRTTAATTATIKAGSADDLRIVAAGSITLTSGTAVTLNSGNKVTNEGTIKISDANDATGILAVAGSTGTILNTGTITIDESYAPTDADKDGDLDGGLAQGQHRFGIRTAGAFTGNVGSTGTITIEGNDSAGIALDGPLTGTLTTGGTTSVIGDRSVGVRAGNISGAVRIAGTVSAQGKDAVGVSLLGDIGGALVVQGNVSATGYRSTTAPADVTKLDADDLLQGGPALNVGGNVAGGIVLAIAPRDLDPKDLDEDKDGIPDATEGAAAVTSYGAAPAVRIGAADRSVTIGAVAGSGFGLVVDGTVSGLGVYKDVAATAMQIGGLGGAVTIAGGIAVSGTVQAIANNASATGLRIGNGATVGEIRVAGVVAAGGGGTATSTSTAIAIDAGATVGTIRNTGQVKAVASGVDGFTTGIVDRSGKLTLIENSGGIDASGATATSTRNVAIDLSANTTGATVRQIAGATGAPAASIVGDIKFGSGNDTLALGGKSTFTGTTDFGGGTDQLSITEGSRFTGTLLRSGNTAVNVASGTLQLNTKSAVTIGSLSVGAQGVLGVTIDAAAKTNTLFQVAGAASFAAGSQVALTLGSVSHAEGHYVIVKAGSISGASNLTASTMLLPFLFKTVVVSGSATEIAVDLKRKTNAELGLNSSQSLALDAVVKVLDSDAKVAGAFLDISDAKRFGATLRQFLPDHAGGSFEAVTQGSRATARLIADPQGMVEHGRWSSWLQQAAWGRSKSVSSTAGFDVSGWGAAGGGEIATAAGSFGGSVAYLHGKDADGGTDNEVGSDQYEAAAYWRGNWGGFSANARVSGAHIGFTGTRRFDGQIGTEAVTRNTEGDWNGRLFSASGGIAYEARLGRLTFRPIAAADYYNLHEGGYTEKGGGKAFDLIVGSRTSDELALSATLAAGLNFGDKTYVDKWFRVETEGGRRQIVGGKLGDTTAHFEGGDAFTLRAQDRTNGWVGRLRAVGGAGGFRLVGEVSAEEQQGRTALSARAGVSFAL